eukprot:9218062-Pyramimonas_sp.AAC.1
MSVHIRTNYDHLFRFRTLSARFFKRLLRGFLRGSLGAFLETPEKLLGGFRRSSVEVSLDASVG